MVKLGDMMQVNWVSKVITILFLLSPLLSNFAFYKSVSLGDISIMLVATYLILVERKDFFLLPMEAHISLLILLILLLISVLHFTENTRIILSAFRHVSYLALCFFIIKLKDIKLAATYIVLAIIFSSLLIIQKVYFMTTGHYFLFFDPSLEIQKTYIAQLGNININDTFRTGGLFCEPSYFALYLIPALIITSKTHNYLLYLFFSLAIFMSTSALGILMTLIYPLKLIDNYKEKNISILIVMSLMICMLISLMLIFTNPTIFDGLKEFGSFNVRFFSPIINYIEFNSGFLFPNPKIIGATTDYNQWCNSLIYTLSLFGSGILLVYFFLLKKIKYIQLRLSLLLILIFTNALPSPYLVVIIGILYNFERIKFNYKLPSTFLKIRVNE